MIIIRKILSLLWVISGVASGVFSQGVPAEQSPSAPKSTESIRQKEWEKKKKKLKREAEKEYKKRLKRHYKIQSKSTLRQMKEYEKKRKKLQKRSKEFFLVRWVKKGIKAWQERKKRTR